MEIVWIHSVENGLSRPAICNCIVKIRHLVLVDRLTCWTLMAVLQLQGHPSARGLGYVDISSISSICYPETEMMTTQLSQQADGSPCTSTSQNDVNNS